MPKLYTIFQTISKKHADLITTYQTILQTISNKRANQPPCAWQLLHTLWNRLRESLWWNKTPLCTQWLEYPNRHTFWQWKTGHRGKAWLRKQSL